MNLKAQNKRLPLTKTQILTLLACICHGSVQAIPGQTQPFFTKDKQHIGYGEDQIMAALRAVGPTVTHVSIMNHPIEGFTGTIYFEKTAPKRDLTLVQAALAKLPTPTPAGAPTVYTKNTWLDDIAPDSQAISTDWLTENAPVHFVDTRNRKAWGYIVALKNSNAIVEFRDHPGQRWITKMTGEHRSSDNKNWVKAEVPVASLKPPGRHRTIQSIVDELNAKNLIPDAMPVDSPEEKALLAWIEEQNPPSRPELTDNEVKEAAYRAAGLLPTVS